MLLDLSFVAKSFFKNWIGIRKSASRTHSGFRRSMAGLTGSDHCGRPGHDLFFRVERVGGAIGESAPFCLVSPDTWQPDWGAAPPRGSFFKIRLGGIVRGLKPPPPSVHEAVEVGFLVSHPKRTKRV